MGMEVKVAAREAAAGEGVVMAMGMAGAGEWGTAGLMGVVSVAAGMMAAGTSEGDAEATVALEVAAGARVAAQFHS